MCQQQHLPSNSPALMRARTKQEHKPACVALLLCARTREGWAVAGKVLLLITALLYVHNSSKALVVEGVMQAATTGYEQRVSPASLL